jgi:hypothetical protein
MYLVIAAATTTPTPIPPAAAPPATTTPTTPTTTTTTATTPAPLADDDPAALLLYVLDPHTCQPGAWRRADELLYAPLRAIGITDPSETAALFDAELVVFRFLANVHSPS